ncbi:MAG: DinB family protein [Planctomycetota bacterium]|nr:DinB family protein [Planctomycetota bacterium]
MSASPRLDDLRKQLEAAYRRRAWHGSNLRGLLRGVDARRAAFRTQPRRHNLWELIVHCAYWKYAVRRQISGERRGGFPLKGSNWFKRPVEPTEAAWRADLRLLDREHERLMDLLSSLPAGALDRKPAGSRFTVAELLAGAAAHDLYHAGQVALLKRLAP